MKNKMTTTELKQYVIAEATKLMKKEVLKERKETIDKELKLLSEDYLPKVPSSEEFEETLNDFKEIEELTDDVEAIEKYIEMCHRNIEDSLMMDHEDGSFLWQSRIKAAMNKLNELLPEHDPKFQQIVTNHKRKMKEIFSN